MLIAHSILLQIECHFHLLSNFLWIRPDIIQPLRVEQHIHEVHFHASDRNLPSNNIPAHIVDSAEAFRPDDLRKLLVDFVGIEEVLVSR